MLRWSWGRWPDVLIDFGRELYVPWQLVSGKVLYTDIESFNGPLSPYWNALWFRVFGTSLLTLVISNLLILTCLVFLLHRLLSEICDQFATTMACLTFVTLFAFGQLGDVGNYNFVCPYSHELTHGLALSFAAIACLSVYHRSGGFLAVAGAGSALGLVLLTKAEVFLAAALALLVGFGLTIWLERPLRHRLLALLATFAGSAAVPPLLSFGLLGLAMPAEQALRRTLGTWPWVLHTDPFTLRFYRHWMGTLDVRESVRTILVWTGLYAAVFLPAAALSLVFRKPGWLRGWASTGVSTVLLAVLVSMSHAHLVNLRNAWRPLPLVVFLLGVASFLMFIKQRQDPQASRRLTLRLSLIVLAFALLGKMGLYARVQNVGFGLAMPAALLVVVALIDWIPSGLTNRGGYGNLFRTAGVVVVMFTIVDHLHTTAFYFSHKTYRVSAGDDAFLADEQGPLVNRVLGEIVRRVGPNETLLVLPHGVMLNYLTRRVNPTPYIVVDPLMLASYGEERILASFNAHAPDDIVLVAIDEREHGVRLFGHDFGQRIYSWIREHYREVRLFGSSPLQEGTWGILLLQRSDHHSALTSP